MKSSKSMIILIYKVLSFIPPPGCIRAAHPAVAIEEVRIFPVEEIVGQVALAPQRWFSDDVLRQVGNDGGTIVQVYACELFRFDIAFAFDGFVCQRSAQNIIDVHRVSPRSVVSASGVGCPGLSYINLPPMSPFLWRCNLPRLSKLGVKSPKNPLKYVEFHDELWYTPKKVDIEKLS